MFKPDADVDLEAAKEGITAVMTGSAAFMPFETIVERDMRHKAPR